MRYLRPATTPRMVSVWWVALTTFECSSLSPSFHYNLYEVSLEPPFALPNKLPHVKVIESPFLLITFGYGILSGLLVNRAPTELAPEGFDHPIALYALA